MRALHEQRAPRRVTVLGSTGSVGCNTLDLIGRAPEAFEVQALTGNRNVAMLAEQARRFRPQLAVVADESKYGALRDALADTEVRVAAGHEAVCEAASMPSDWVMAAIVGATGLAPTLSAVRRGAVVALANKECLVCAGALMIKEVSESGATLLPVDSEHNAIFQVLDVDRAESIERIILTASGGPFRTAARESLANVTPAQAVAHPNWDMGAKISVDSATMMNKGLELIEAYHLFPVTGDRIEILVHPESVVHSMVAYVDGSVLAQLGTPDMRTPIGYALGWPERMATPATRLDLAALGRLTFERPDPVRFPALALARAALESGGAAPIVLNAANEVAVHSFLGGKTGFLAITDIVEATLDKVPGSTIDCLDDVYQIDADARRVASALVEGG